MYVSLLVSAVAACPELGVVGFVVMVLPMIVLVLLVAVAAMVAVFGGRERAGRARLVLRNLLGILRKRDGRW